MRPIITAEALQFLLDYFLHADAQVSQFIPQKLQCALLLVIK